MVHQRALLRGGEHARPRRRRPDRLLPDGAADAAFGNASAWHCEWIRSILDAAEDYAVEGEAQLGRRPSLGGLPQAVEQGADLDATEEADDDATIAQLEVQVWLELDALVNPDAPRGEGASARLMTDADVPPELLGLLPPAPPGGSRASAATGRRRWRRARRGPRRRRRRASPA